MEFKDNCVICRIPMTRNKIIRLLPCRHLLHTKCQQNMNNVPDATCPICRAVLTGTETTVRKKYKKNTNRDRERIVNCANKGDDWVSLAATLDIKYKTAFHWIRSGRDKMLAKGGIKHKILNEEQIDSLVSWVEEDCSCTLQQLKVKILTNFNTSISVSTVGNYLEGRLFTMKKVHNEPCTMNSDINKRKRAEYVQSLNNYIRQGKQIVWIDETNFNLFCRRTRGRALAGTRAVQLLPAARGPNVHLIGAISTAGVVAMERRRGSFTAQLANAWVTRLMQQWQDIGNELEDLVIVSDNAPCHSNLETVINGTAASLLRLGPYSPMLNPIETIWSKVKAYAKNNIRIPSVTGPGLMEQRLVYLEEIIDQAKNTVAGGDCARAVQHCSIHQAVALAMNNMPVGS